MKTDYDDTLMSIIVLLGDEGKHWYYLPMDAIEWTDPYYNHQN